MSFANMSKSSNGYVQTTGNTKREQPWDDVEMHNFTATVADKWQGTLADKRDMVMLGRSQVLRVRIHPSFPSCPSTAEQYMAAEFQLHLHPRLLGRPHLYLGAHLRVSV